ncbi:hypothetical protein UA08_02304 [Talaromyces atroroseus]|uniref:Uncharacterized protein n=1 Tax=Talaromyces atroroseus TaxID=1441469 RepID=A0A225AV97_TALAT|nr:hypothetical protein UA08_02304 [Talaromyces atroroseus]OKL62294.1 hypothetical protein UA08_02304 [Talaromyces atroroseus]
MSKTMFCSDDSTTKEVDLKRSVLTDLETVSNDISKLDSDITGWDGSLLTALPLLSDVSTLESDIKTATTDTEASSAFDDSDSASVTSEVESLQTLIATTLSDLVDKESEVAAIGFTSTVQSNLKTLESLANDLLIALEAKVTSTDATTVKTAATGIDSSFASAISAY